MRIICHYCKQDIDAKGQDNMGEDGFDVCEDCNRTKLRQTTFIHDSHCPVNFDDGFEDGGEDCSPTW